MKPPSPLSSPSVGRGIILVTHWGYAKVSSPKGAEGAFTSRGLLIDEVVFRRSASLII